MESLFASLTAQVSSRITDPSQHASFWAGANVVVQDSGALYREARSRPKEGQLAMGFSSHASLSPQVRVDGGLLVGTRPMFVDANGTVAECTWMQIEDGSAGLLRHAATLLCSRLRLKNYGPRGKVSGYTERAPLLVAWESDGAGSAP